MSNIWFCSDLHLGHKNIGKFRAPIVNSTEENNKRIYSDWNINVRTRDHVYVLGDWCFDMEMIEDLTALPGKKFLIRGNHDKFDLGVYTKYFNDVYGLLKYKEFWLSHAPIHPNELRGKFNLHGHVHYASIDDSRYFNCCPENLWPMKDRCLISLDEVRRIYEDRNRGPGS